MVQACARWSGGACMPIVRRAVKEYPGSRRGEHLYSPSVSTHVLLEGSTMRLSPIGLMLTLALCVAPLAAEAQPAEKVWRIGYLVAGFGRIDEAFRQGLRDLGYVEGENLTIEYRHADNQLERLADLAAELVRLPVDVLVTAGENAARAAQQATRTIPIVLAAGSDPVGLGLIASLARPGGNITGVTLHAPEVMGKWLELLKEAVPTASRVGVLFNPASTGAVSRWRETESAARSLKVQLHALEVRHADELEPAFATATGAGVGALLVWRNFLIDTYRPRILQWAAQHRLPVMAELREYVEDGGLLFYAPSQPDVFRRAATYVDKILKGATPADLPVEQPMKYELVLNLKTAQALGLTMPPSLLLLADEVIR
jgi:putative tryptophan/tyrosine transport system substrate-binding protein